MHEIEPGATPDLAERYGPLTDDANAFREYLDRPLDRFIWTHTGRMEPERLGALLKKAGFGPERLPWHPAAFRITGNPDGLGNHWTYLAGLFHIQEASSMLPALLLNPQPGDRVLDLCAAPGGKTAQAAVAMKNRGTVAANDLVGARLRPLRMNADRLGLMNVTVSCHDGVNLPKSAGTFDFVMADVPCSCEGTSRKNPGILDRPGSQIIRPYRKQKLLLRQAIRRCRPGGKVVYSTCTYAPEENEGVVSEVLEEWPDLVRLVPANLPGFRASPGVMEWEGRKFPEAVRHCLRVWPHQNDTGGFFVAVLEKLRGGSLDAAADRGEPWAVSDSEFPGAGKFQQFPARDDAGLRAFLTDRFGLPETALSGLVLLEKPDKQLFLVAADHRPPILPDRLIGLPLLHLKGAAPKMTTAGALALGRDATRNVLDMEKEQRDLYLGRQTFQATEEQAKVLDGGWVIVRYGGYPLGLGLFRKDTGLVESSFPKHMSVR
ncbi:MAG: SAM-dependent methyltransferase [Desulfococcaceae bacterium]